MNSDAIITLHSFLLNECPDGLPSNAFSIFYKAHPKAASAIRRRKVKTICRDYPNLFSWTEDQDDGMNGYGLVKAIKNDPNETLNARLEYSYKIAMEFFNQNLRHDVTIRRKCEDRYFFDQLYSEWKSKQRAKGRNMVGCSPSQILFHLKHMKILDAKADGGVLLWAEDLLNENQEKSSITREELIEQAKLRVVHAREELEKNQNGAEVALIDFGYRDEKVIKFGVPLVQDVTVWNRSFEGILNVKVNSSLAEPKGIHLVGPSTAHLDEGDEVQVKLEVRQPNRGITRALIIFQFTGVDEWGRPIKPFTIVRYIDLNVGDSDDHELIKAKTPYRKKKIRQGHFLKPIPFDIPSIGGGKFLNKLPSYGIPMYWRDTLRSNATQDVLTELYYPERCPDAFGGGGGGGDADDDDTAYHASHLMFQNYGQIFHRLLWTEEFQMELDIRQYDMTNVAIMRQNNRRCSLNIPGLAENRPSVLKGDLITIQLQGSKSQCFESYVDRVTLENASLIFPRAFEDRFLNGTKVDVRFRFRRVQLRCMHQSLDFLSESSNNRMLERVLFPVAPKSDVLYPPLIVEPSTVEELRLYNKDLNREQKLAVFGAMRSVARPAPYLIYGPPGTGKTVTVVETILQIMKSRCMENAKLLVCAPSNAAVDLIVERLAPYFTTRELLRLIAFSRDPQFVPSNIQHYASFDQVQNGYVAPPLMDLEKYGIIATTVSYAGKLFNLGVENHFSHIIIDEAGHAIEPEILSCIAKIAKTESSLSPPAVVLAGDPKQLGPVVRNEIAKSFGLEQSMLERLSKREVYGKNQCDVSANDLPSYDTRMITKLVKNYRSHPSILTIPNEFFYDNDLIPSADLFRAYSLVKWEHLPSQNFPIIFHGIEGADTREGNSPSWFNPDEASLVKHYVNLLVNETRTNKCEPCDIGVVTPYHKQVQKVRTLLKASHFEDVKVGSVEEFQGSERRVIIVSTVRSSTDYIESDNRHKLGFLSNPKRFNVAITRAQALLIVIGNPALLQHDKYWDSFIQFCRKHRGYVGCHYEPGLPTLLHETDADNDDLLCRLADMKLNTTSEDDEKEQDDDEISDDFVMVSEVTAQEGPAWNCEE
mmetsp:Transcript_2545/g.4761  ORF Transcript_2545/g.4761 Transcript_2545/m.4761 type:complete len:1100 (-) Transcript_2545:102-3401(-)